MARIKPHWITIIGVLVVAVGSLRCSSQPRRESTPGQVQASVAQSSFLPAPAFAQLVANQGEGNVSVIADIAEKVVPSVVNISTERVVRMRGSGRFQNRFFREFFGEGFRQLPREQRQQTAGSGVIVSSDGLVLTNSHVIEDATKVQVTLSDGRDYEAKVVGTDPATDVGVLRISEKVDGLKSMEIGDASTLRLGDVVLAIGNPFGVGQTVTMGIVSAKGRANVGLADYEDFIQTDAAINPGNSGGALVNTRGELVGINTAIVSRSGGYEGIGFAIPSNMARQIMDSLVKDGRVSRGWLGVAIQDVDRDLAKALKLKVEQGVLINDVTDDSPAVKAGIERGDVITEVNGKVVNTSQALQNAIAGAGGNSTVELKILRDGKVKTLSVELGERQEDGEQGSSVSDGESEQSSGLTLSTLNGEARRRFRISEDVESGVVVVSVRPGSRAAQAGLRPGDVIREIARRSISSVSEAQAALKTEERIAIFVRRGASGIYFALPPPSEDE